MHILNWFCHEVYDYISAHIMHVHVLFVLLRFVTQRKFKLIITDFQLVFFPERSRNILKTPLTSTRPCLRL